jgi:LacI family transcriptional regulator
LKHRVGTKRIAKVAGVSTATVDRVLNKRPGVSPMTIQKVLDAVSTLNDESLSKLAGTKRQKRFSFAIAIQSGTSFNERMQQKLSMFDKSLLDKQQIEIRESITTDRGSESFAQRLLQAYKNTDGMILACQDTPIIRDTVNELARQGYPVVCITTDLPTTHRLAYVAMDQYRSGRAAGTLIGRFTCGQPGEVLFIISGNYRCQQEREIGFRQVLRESFPQLTVSESLRSEDSNETSYQAMRVYLESGRRPLAIYNVSGGNAGIVQALAEDNTLEKRPVYVCHDLTAEARSSLIAGRIDAVIDYDAEEAIARAVKHLINFHSPNSFMVNSDPLPIRICLPDTV